MLLYLLWLGLLTSFIGSFPLGMLNLTVVNLALQEGWRSALRFALGSSLVEWFQAFAAVMLVSVLQERVSELKFWFTLLSIPIFLILAWQNYSASKQQNDFSKADKRPIPPFRKGLLLSALNVLAYPYWVVLGNVFITQGLPLHGWINVALFSTATAMGAFLALCVFTAASALVRRQAASLNAMASKITAIVFLILAIVMLWSLYQQYQH